MTRLRCTFELIFSVQLQEVVAFQHRAAPKPNVLALVERCREPDVSTAKTTDDAAKAKIQATMVDKRVDVGVKETNQALRAVMTGAIARQLHRVESDSCGPSVQDMLTQWSGHGKVSSSSCAAFAGSPKELSDTFTHLQAWQTFNLEECQSLTKLPGSLDSSRRRRPPGDAGAEPSALQVPRGAAQGPE